MEFRNLGDAGLRVSVAGLGTNNFGGRLDQAGTTAVVQESLDQGITLFDTADIYGGGLSEEYLGKALGSRRSEVIIATKFGATSGDGPYNEGASRHYIHHCVEASLRRLGTDYIDLYQLHTPDPHTPIEETLRALDDLVRVGKVRYVGSSNFSGWQIADADWTARAGGLTRMVTAQNEWSLLKREVELDVIPSCERFRVGMLPYFPLASGFLTGKYQRGEAFGTDTRLHAWGARMPDYLKALTSGANWDHLEHLRTFAEAAGHTVHELALGWLASRPVVTSVIAGATSPEQVRGNVAATEAWALAADEMAEVDRILADPAP
jgi:aryl-alcohol dehydrogenase-like predicted oxidoreductase